MILLNHNLLEIPLSDIRKTEVQGTAFKVRSFTTHSKEPIGHTGRHSSSTLKSPFKELNIVDYGDAPTDMLSTERSVHAIREFVRQVASVKNKKGKNVMPFVIGAEFGAYSAGMPGWNHPAQERYRCETLPGARDRRRQSQITFAGAQSGVASGGNAGSSAQIGNETGVLGI